MSIGSRPCESHSAAPFTPIWEPIQALKGLAASACLFIGRERCLESANCSTCDIGDIAVCSIRTMKLFAHSSLGFSERGSALLGLLGLGGFKRLPCTA